MAGEQIIAALVRDVEHQLVLARAPDGRDRCDVAAVAARLRGDRLIARQNADGRIGDRLVGPVAVEEHHQLPATRDRD